MKAHIINSQANEIQANEIKSNDIQEVKEMSRKEIRAAKKAEKLQAKADKHNAKIDAKLDAKAEEAIKAQEDMLIAQAKNIGMDYVEYRALVKESTIDILAAKREAKIKAIEIAGAVVAGIAIVSGSAVAIAMHKKTVAVREEMLEAEAAEEM